MFAVDYACPCCRAELQQTGEELLSAFSMANSALEYIPPVDVNGITVKSAAAKTKGVCCTSGAGMANMLQATQAVV